MTQDLSSKNGEVEPRHSEANATNPQDPVPPPPEPQYTDDADNNSDADLSYIRLDTDYADELCWSNDPGDLAISTYFDPRKLNLGSNLLVTSLCPILREDDMRDKFIWTDDKNCFYVWNEWDGRLFWVRHKEIEIEILEDKMDFVLFFIFILYRFGALEVEPVFSTWHPVDEDLEALRAGSPKCTI